MFKELHHQETPLILCNVWDAASAIIADKLGYLAIGTSSAAIATSLGKTDGHNICYEKLLAVVKQISEVTTLPLSVDIEAGYADTPQEIVDNIAKLAKLGVVGINIEDSQLINGRRSLVGKHDFSEKLSQIKAHLNNAKIEMFINVRSDTYIVDAATALPETIERISLYEDAGADGIFLPCLTALDDIRKLVAHCNLPLNIMCMPELASFGLLQQLGVKRISMGNFVYDNMLAHLENTLSSIKQQGSFKPLNLV
ncbi:isocitrate lyase/phosphoenolpyruvate mutase family protein [Pseudoalteromonas phenolica]|uniref:Isocitrate lyase/phosphoenolpyruvate mutase family protein n=1 Tax=Pseudoalteromonas phenolica TaxID=161398 RepID=A0A5R9Q2C6_9GAMM|nr:isocitrate lyase/phosphoenolpyruvate mutase family protein [Pseudoalteromonas phenolica]TLX46762.1 isocitrate lyase/phosphoenolpyruvate mutase family protein [Pseudoalteromonas phenolica]